MIPLHLRISGFLSYRDFGFIAVEAEAQSKKPLVRLNYSGSIYATTSVVAVEKGFFDQEGLIVNATPESSGNVALQALIGSSTDFAEGANVRPIQALAQDLPVKVIALSTYGFAGYVIVPAKDTTTKTLEDLKGNGGGIKVEAGVLHYGLGGRIGYHQTALCHTRFHIHGPHDGRVDHHHIIADWRSSVSGINCRT